jgi:hypothetical protein
MAELSPDAQAVQDAMCSRWPRSREWIAAAALRAAVDQVLPGRPHPHRDRFLAIAAELEAHQDKLDRLIAMDRNDPANTINQEGNGNEP